MFYVTMISGRRVAYLVGPFDTHKEALSFVEPARKKANELDPFTHFYAFGTARSEASKKGFLNSAFGLK